MNSPVRRWVIGLIVFGICLSYLVISIARGPRAPVFGYTTELYALQAQSFLQGKTTLPIEPRPELLSLPDPYDAEANKSYRLHDASLYKGKYYMYFGAVPAVTLFVPYRLLTGRDLPNRVAVPIFCIGGFLSSCVLFFWLARHNRWALPLWLECVILISLGSMSLVSLILRRPSFYEVAIAGGHCFVMAGFLALARAVWGTGKDRQWLLLAGLLLGLAVGCRPHLAVICCAVLVSFAIRVRCNLRLMMPLAALMLATGAALGWYNYVRFDSPFEFGASYQLGGFSFSILQRNFETIFRSAREFLFVTPHLDMSMPFIHTVYINPLTGSNGPVIWTEDTVGLIPAAPFALLGFFTPFFLRTQQIDKGIDEASRWLLSTIYWSSIAVFVILCALGWVMGRYLADFAPLLTFDGAVVVAISWQSLSESPSRYALRWGTSMAAIYGVILNIAIATPRSDLILKFLHK